MSDDRYRYQIEVRRLSRGCWISHVTEIHGDLPDPMGPFLCQGPTRKRVIKRAERLIARLKAENASSERWVVE